MPFGKNKNYKNLIISLSAVLFFALLMLFGLKHDPNFNPSPLIGKKAPAFISQLSSGKIFKFDSSVSNTHWTIINFWTSACVICREEAPNIEKFYSRISLADKNNPQLLSINIQDSADDIIQWQKSFALTFPVIQDKKGTISVSYGVTGTPETFVIDPNYIVRYRIAGVINTEKIINFINWLQKNPSATSVQSAQALQGIEG